MKVLLKGYSALCKIGNSNRPILLTSHTLTMNTNVIKGTSINQLWNNSSYGFNRYNGYAVRDFAGYDLSISFQVTKDVFNDIMEIVFQKPHNCIKIQLQDKASSFSYTFNYCYIKSMSLTVENNSVANINMSFIIFKDVVEYGISSEYNVSAINIADSSLVGNVLMPYYFFGVSHTNFQNNKNELKSFNIDFSQQITPKYGCCGSSVTTYNAIQPQAVVFSLPTITYNLNYVMYNTPNQSALNTYASNVWNENINVSCTYGDKAFLVLSNCYVDTYTPNVGGSQQETFNITGSVYGNAIVTKIKQ